MTAHGWPAPLKPDAKRFAVAVATPALSSVQAECTRNVRRKDERLSRRVEVSVVEAASDGAGRKLISHR
jgi:hypothetical protein